VTPFLDEAVATGLLFEKTISVNSFTLPCVTSYLTGLYPFRHGLRVQTAGRLGSEHRLLFEWLKPLGYHTFARIGGAFGRENNIDRNVDDYDQGHRSASFQQHYGTGLIAALREKRFPRPWMGYVHILDVHEPRLIPPEFDSPRYGTHPYDRALSSLDPWLRRTAEAAGENTIIVITGDHGEGFGTGIKGKALERLLPLRKLVNAGLMKILRPYWHRVGPEVVAVKKRVMLGGKAGSARRTDEARGHGWACYDPQVRVPLIFMNVPDAAPRRVTQMVRTVDLVPTLLDLVGASGWQAADLDGVSLRPVLQGNKIGPLTAYSESSTGQVENVPDGEWRMAVRTDAAKYICSPFLENRREELYDLVNDLKETTNIAAKNPALLQELRRELERISPEVAAGRFGIGAAEADKMSEEDAAAVEQRLRDLGYID